MNRTIIMLVCIITTVLLACQNSEEDLATETPVPATSLESEKSETPKQVVGQARIEPEGKISKLAPLVSGVVTKVWKQENDWVKSGETILELGHSIPEAKVAQAQSKILTQQAKISMHELEVNEISVRVRNKEKEVQRILELLSKGSETQQRADDAVTELEVLKISLERAIANRLIAKAALSEIERERDLLRAELSQYFVKAPSNGKLLSMNVVSGSAVQLQEPFAEFAPEGKLIARAEIDELFAGLIAVGQKVNVRLVGNEKIISTGKVIDTSSSLKRKSLFSEDAGDQEDRRVREVEIELDNTKSMFINSRLECIISIQ